MNASNEKLKRQNYDDGESTEDSSSDSDYSDLDSRKCCCCRHRKGKDVEVRENPTPVPIHFTQPGANDRPYSHDHSPHVTDEVFNAASHLMGGMLFLLGSVSLITSAAAAGNPWAIVAFSLYGFSLNFLFWASFCHHAIRGSDRLMHILRQMDYVAIYFLIPGTMSPICLICLHARWEGWVFFGTSWGLALFGVLMQTMCRGKMALPTWASMTMYVTLGWFGFFLAFPSMPCIGAQGIALIAFGGIVYTAGGAIFTSQCPNPHPGVFGFHEIWHIFVLAGAAIHFAFNFFYVQPAMY